MAAAALRPSFEDGVGLSRQLLQSPLCRPVLLERSAAKCIWLEGSCGAGMRARDYTQSSRGCNGEDAINATGEEIDRNVQLADEIRGNGVV